MTCSIIPFRRRAIELSPNDAHYVNMVQEMLKDVDGLYRNAFWSRAGKRIGMAYECAKHINNATARHAACDDISRMEKLVEMAEELAVRRG